MQVPQYTSTPLSEGFGNGILCLQLFQTYLWKERILMAQTAKNQKQDSTTLRSSRPGQRQQERLQRQARRKRRRQIWTASLITLLLIALGGVIFWQVQQFRQRQADQASATQTATSQKQATATAIHAAATATVTATYAAATATVLGQNCFVSPAGTPTDPIYTSAATPTAGPTTSPHITGTPITEASGLKYIDIKVGTGAAAKAGSTVNVEYSGWMASNCQKFDSSYDPHGSQPAGQAFPVTPLGQAQVIPGWNLGLVGMKAGGTRRLYIPSSLAYGPQGNQGIPPNADLIFDVTVLSIT